MSFFGTEKRKVLYIEVKRPNILLQVVMQILNNAVLHFIYKKNRL